jgi:hypothetical protein
MTVGDGLAVAILSGLVGLTELLTRYRADPKRLTRSLAALAYVTLNAAAGLGALGIIHAVGWTFGGETAGARRLVQVMVAGLGATAISRSSLFIVRIGNSDVGLGPSTILTSLLGAIDRVVDRDQARYRALRVEKIMKGVSFKDAYEALPTYCLALMQNLPAEDQEALGLAVAALERSEMDDDVKALALGIELMNTVGPDVLEVAVRTLGSRINAAFEPTDENDLAGVQVRNASASKPFSDESSEAGAVGEERRAVSRPAFKRRG